MYNKFINKYKTQVIPNVNYSEIHHILPKHVGGDNSSENLIRLTYRQHVLAHLLLYRKYKRIEDITAYKMMRSLPHERKSIICKMIGQRHVESGHIQALGRKNAETGWINSIKTTESLSRGGKRAGQIAKETGQILSIRTDEGSKLGGVIAGARARDSGQIQSLAKYKSKYVLIAPDGTEFQHPFLMAMVLKIPRELCYSRCKAKTAGYSCRLKTPEELANAFSNVELNISEHFTANVLPKKAPESIYCWVDNENNKFNTPQELAEAHNITVAIARSRCKRNNMGFSRQLKSASIND